MQQGKMICPYCGEPKGRCRATVENIHGEEIGLMWPSLHADHGFPKLELNPRIGVSSINRYLSRREQATLLAGGR